MRLDAAEAVVGRAVQRDDIQALADELDEGQEELAVEAVSVEIVRLEVGGGDDGGPMGQKPLEQAAHDHGIGDVGDLHLVEAEQPGFLRDGFRHGRDRILRVRLARGMEALVHLLHEGVEVDAALGVRIRHGMEQVHHHGLAAPDLAVDVKAFRRGRGFLEAGEEARGGCRLQVLGQRIELRHHGALRGIGFEDAAVHAAVVFSEDGGHYAPLLEAVIPAKAGIQLSAGLTPKAGPRLSPG
jgi:hypothetical protein